MPRYCKCGGRYVKESTTYGWAHFRCDKCKRHAHQKLRQSKH